LADFAVILKIVAKLPHRIVPEIPGSILKYPKAAPCRRASPRRNDFGGRLGLEPTRHALWRGESAMQ
jgi:hypothetical protein